MSILFILFLQNSDDGPLCQKIIVVHFRLKQKKTWFKQRHSSNTQFRQLKKKKPIPNIGAGVPNQ